MAEQPQAIEKLPAALTAEMLAKEESVFLNVARFEHAQRVARVLAESTMVPDHFRGNVGNCLIALNLAERMRLDPFMLMQSVYVVHGRPGIEGKLAIALIEGYGRFGRLEYECKGSGKTEKGIDRPDECRAYAKDLKSGKIVHGPTVSWSMAVAEGWTKSKKTRDGSGEIPSKWQTLPDLMFRYRAATFFGRVHCPAALLGLRTAEELEDLTPKVNIMPASFGKDEGADRARADAIAKFKASIPSPLSLEHPELQEFLGKLAQANRCQVEEVMAEASGKAGEFWQGYEEWLKENRGKSQTAEAGRPIRQDEHAAPPSTTNAGRPPIPFDRPAGLDDYSRAYSDEVEKKNEEVEDRKKSLKKTKPAASGKKEMIVCPPGRRFAGKEVSPVFCASKSCPDKECPHWGGKQLGPGEDDQ